MSSRRERCPTCKGYKAPLVKIETFAKEDEPPWAQSLREVETWKGLTPETEFRHAVAADKIVARYDFTGNGWRVKCSFPGRHKHARGFIVETVCGLTLRIGSTCGAQEVDGFRDAAKRVDAANKYFSTKKAIERLIAELPGRFQKAITNVEELVAWRGGFATAFPQHARVLASDRALPFKGLALWREQRPYPKAFGNRFDALRREYRRGGATITMTDATRISRQLGNVERDLRECERWVERASAFLWARNMLEFVPAFGIVGATVATNSLQVKQRGGVLTLRAKLV